MQEVAVAAAQLRAVGSAFVIELDDNLLEYNRFFRSVRPTWWNDLHDKPRAIHRMLADVADGLIVATESIADAYCDVNDTIVVQPHSVDLNDCAHITKPDDGVFRIGFAGSNSHAEDVALIIPALRWASAQPGVEVVAIGLEPRWDFPHRPLPAVGVDEYRQELACLDVGLCPLLPDPWNICRSDSKAPEYTLARAAVIASDQAPFNAFRGRVPMASHAAGFLEATEWLVNDRIAAASIASVARSYIERERTTTANAATLRRTVALFS